MVGDSFEFLSETRDCHGEKNRPGQYNEFNFSLHPTIYNNADIPGWRDDWCRYENINISVSSFYNVEMRTNYQTHRHSLDWWSVAVLDISIYFM